MPLLPRKNNLDYNPDNIIQASKRLATISLEQMKNPLFDPDQATLSTLDSERNLDANMSELGKKILDIQQLFLTGKNLAFSEATKRGIQYERDERLNQQTAELRRQREEINRAENILGDIYGDFGGIYNEIGRMRGEGRTKGAKDKSPRKSKTRPRQNIQLVIEDETPDERSERLTQQSIRNYFGRNPARDAMPSTIVSREPNGRYSVLPLLDYGRRLETTGAVADADDEDPENESEDYGYNPFTGNRWDSGGDYPDDNDDDDDDDDSDGRPRGRFPYGNPDDADLSNVKDDDFNQTILPQASLSQVLQLLTKKCRDADILLISKIKPALQKLSQQQLQQLTQFYELLGKGWKDFSSSTSKDGKTIISIFDIIYKSLQYGDQIIKIMKEEFDKLRMDLLIVVNSYKQNEAVAPPFYLPVGNEWAVNPEVRELVETGERLDDRGVPAETASVSSTGTGSGRGGRRSKSQPIAIPTIWSADVRSCPTKYLL